MGIIESARELGKVIQQDPAYIRLQIAKTANDKDNDLQEKIGEFNLKRMSLNEEASKEDSDSEKVSVLNKELMEIYENIMQNENMLEYNLAKTEIDNVMNHVNTILVGAVNGENPDEIEMSSCSGGCSTCGGCH